MSQVVALPRGPVVVRQASRPGDQTDLDGGRLGGAVRGTGRGGVARAGAVRQLPRSADLATVNLFEPVDNQPRVDITGVETFPTTGQLRLTTVSVTRADSQLTLPEALLSYWLSAREVLPRDSVYPAACERPARLLGPRGAQSMDNSQSAAAAGLRAAGQKVTEYPMVQAVSNGSPADGKLKPGDFILRIDNKTVSTIEGVRRSIQSHAVGQAILFTVLRDGQQVSETVTGVASNANPNSPVVGINLAVGYSYTPTVTFYLIFYVF